jgi:hypothetical protein
MRLDVQHADNISSRVIIIYQLVVLPTFRGQTTVTQHITEDQLAQALIKLIKEKRPENVQQLVDLAEEQTAVPRQRIIELVLRLQNLGKIALEERSRTPPQELFSYLKTSEAYWYWATLILAIATTITIFAIPEDAYPLVSIRYVFGTIFVIWLPGYSFMRALFPKKNHRIKSKRALEPVERITLSLGMSLALVSLVGLILNYSPWGIRLTPIILTLLSLTTVFATVSILREHRDRLSKETK